MTYRELRTKIREQTLRIKEDIERCDKIDRDSRNRLLTLVTMKYDEACTRMKRNESDRVPAGKSAKFERQMMEVLEVDVSVQLDLPEELFEKRSAKSNVDVIIQDTITDLGTIAFARLEWVIRGMHSNQNFEQRQSDWNKGQDAFSRLNLDSSSLRDVLESIVEVYAEIFWLEQGGVTDVNEKRIKDDWYRAKRYVGFFIADSFVERCIQNQYGDPDECFAFFNEAFVEYLIGLSVEEYLRIKAYLDWGDNNEWNIYNASDEDRDRYYFKALNRLEKARRNCHGMKVSDRFSSLSDYSKNYLAKYNFETISRGKSTTLLRLGVSASQLHYYIKNYYPKMSSAVQQNRLSSKDATEILDLLYEDNTIPNMFEYLMRCPICAAASPELHNRIRKKRNKSPIPETPRPYPQKGAPRA